MLLWLPFLMCARRLRTRALMKAPFFKCVFVTTVCLALACMPGCAGGGKKKAPNLSDRAGMVTGGSSGLKDETITLQ